MLRFTHAEAVKQQGGLLRYAPEEWREDEAPAPPSRARRHILQYSLA